MSAESVSEFHEKCQRLYDKILDSPYSSASEEHQALVRDASVNFDRLWEHIRSTGVMSRNESVDDMSTQALALLTVPFYLGELASRRIINGDHRRRVEVLEVSNALLKRFIDFAETIGLVTEAEVERRLDNHALDRSARVEAHRRKKDLETQLRDLDSKIRLEKAKAKRMRRIIHADSDDDEDATEDRKRHDDADDGAEAVDDVPDEVLRERHLAAAKLRLEEAFETYSMNKREMEMLGSLLDEEKQAAVKQYQEALEQDRSHLPSSALHFPGAQVPNAIDPALANMYFSQTAGVSGPYVQIAHSGVNYKVAGCGHTAPLRQQIRDQAFQDRNAPTKTLAEFAEEETAFMQEQMRLQAKAKQDQADEDAHLGEAGVEERERRKAADWDNWKDDNPANGLTAKGNYS